MGERFTHKEGSLYISGEYFCELDDGDEICLLLNSVFHTKELLETALRVNGITKININGEDLTKINAPREGENMNNKRFTPFTDFLGGTQTILDNGERKTLQELLDTMNDMHEENELLKKEIEQLNRDLDMYEENNVNEVLNALRIELTSRMNDCIEEFKQ